MSVNAGTHDYPFEFVVEPNLPSSIETFNGWIRYWLKAAIECDGKKRNEKTKIGFTINQIVDANNMDPQLLVFHTTLISMLSSLEHNYSSFDCVLKSCSIALEALNTFDPITIMRLV